jgi:hypothetical protein
VVFKNGKSTIVVKANFHSMTEIWPYSPEMDALFKKEGVDKNKFDSAIYFNPENCSKEYSGPCSYRGVINLPKLKEGTIFYLYCLVFSKYKFNTDGTPFFLVTKVSLKKPI